MEILKFPKLKLMTLPALPSMGLSLFFLLLIPVCLYHLLWQRGWDLIWLYAPIASLSLIAAAVLLLETTCMVVWWQKPQLRGKRGLLQGLFRQKHPVLTAAYDENPLVYRENNLRQLAAIAPKCSLIVVAYLPNEQDIIVETLEQILQQVIRPAGGLEVILAYNTPYRLPIEAELWDLVDQYPELRLLPVADSHSKAENLNAAIAMVTGEMTCIFDADHWPAPDAVVRAWSWLAKGDYDVVQGRNVIRNRLENWLTRWIGVEFDCLYGVSHPARSLLVDAALFGGSNGYWRTSALQKVGFSDRLLTEDIDATLRSVRQGTRVVHDPQIFSYELAPADLGAFWSQRQRWSQGWLEVALLYQTKLCSWQSLDPWQKTCWLMMLLYCSLFQWITIQAIALMMHHWIWHSDLPDWFWFCNILAANLTIICNHLQATIANGRSLWWRDAWFYSLISPFFCGIKTLIVLVSIYNACRGHRRWIVTRRQSAKIKAKRSLAPLSKSY